MSEFFIIRKWRAVGLWSFGSEVETKCGICRFLLGDYCSKCQVSSDSEVEKNCIIVWGSCSHVFHMHCISKYLIDHENCPICGQTWDYQRFGK